MKLIIESPQQLRFYVHFILIRVIGSVYRELYTKLRYYYGV
jgi:hypothetical protein